MALLSFLLSHCNANFCSSSRIKYKQMEKEGVGTKCAALYLDWSAAERSNGNLKEALKILQKVISAITFNFGGYVSHLCFVVLLSGDHFGCSPSWALKGQNNTIPPRV